MHKGSHRSHYVVSVKILVFITTRSSRFQLQPLSLNMHWTLLKLAKTTSYDSLLSKVGLKSIEHRRYVQSLLLLHKCVYNFAPNYIKQLFSFRASTYNLRGDMILHLPNFKSKYFHNSFTYITVRLWNSLPNDIRIISSPVIFKSKIDNLELSALARSTISMCVI